ncbi:helix-turn-helix domain-containing protein [Leucobacter sp. W1038]|uniref:helix-turn-helix domain-containing protein n=1 Tax=Leucobacter sp. W1038 TaxID=3438281 RepID=UPI003D999264
MSSFDDQFAIRLREIREQQKLSQDDLAQRMKARGHDFRQQTVYKIETGNRRVIFGEAVDLADSLGFTLDQFIDTDGSPNLDPTLERVGLIREELEDNGTRYARALLHMAQQADAAVVISERQADWIRDVIELEGPAQIHRLGPLIDLEAQVSREGLDVSGKFSSLLFECLKRDEEALRAALKDVIDRDG